MKKTQESSEGDSAGEVRAGVALAWYLRLLYSQEIDKGVTLTQFSLKSGIHKSRLSRLTKSAEGTGLEFLNGFSRYFGRSHGAILDDALKWWNMKGREYALRESAKNQQERTDDLNRRAGRSGSSERLIAIPKTFRPPTDPPEPVSKK